MSNPTPEMIANHQHIEDREAHLRRFGCDVKAGVAFVLAQALPLSGSVLEIGTGKGRFLVELARHAESVTTVDISAEEQQCARLNARCHKVENKIQFVLQDAARLPWPDHTFDAVVTMNAMHHIAHFTQVLEEMLRVLKPGGKLLLSDFTPRGFQLIERAHRAEGGTHPRALHQFADLKRILRGRGLKARLTKGCLQEVLVVEQI